MIKTFPSSLEGFGHVSSRVWRRPAWRLKDGFNRRRISSRAKPKRCLESVRGKAIANSAVEHLSSHPPGLSSFCYDSQIIPFFILLSFQVMRITFNAF